MSESPETSGQSYRYCDVSLPVPVDRAFSYQLPLTLRHRAHVGARVWVPFGSRRLTGVVVDVHNQTPDADTRDVLAVIDDEPVLDAELLSLARWIAEYYCAPLGEVLKGMLPLSGEMRKTMQYLLTDAGRDIARQLSVTPVKDAAAIILAILEQRPRTAEYLSTKVDGAKTIVRS
ncbi:MAG TPA: primosomal protein N', partial [Bryobacteraceae bacterium]|nr:primosomal protein N' [Bryobacteraceae bacterium]